MALQGTLDTFELADVLRLLATTGKTGRLDVTGERGRAAAWLVEGGVVAVDSGGPGDDLAEGTFALLRFRSGSFQFDVGARAELPGPRTEVDELLTRATAMLAEWESISAVVPSTDARLRLAAQLPGEAVTIDRYAWAAVAAIAGGTTVRALGEALGLGEFAVCRSVAALVHMGAVDVDAAASAAPAPGPEPVATTPRIAAASGWGSEPTAVEPVHGVVPAPLTESHRRPAPDPFPEPAPVPDVEPVLPAAATASVDFDGLPAFSPVLRPASEPAPTPDDAGADRGRLIRFLGSTK